MIKACLILMGSLEALALQSAEICWSASLSKSLEGSTVSLGEASAVFPILSDLLDSLAVILSFSTTGASSSGIRSAGRSSGVLYFHEEKHACQCHRKQKNRRLHCIQ